MITCRCFNCTRKELKKYTHMDLSLAWKKRLGATCYDSGKTPESQKPVCDRPRADNGKFIEWG